jgi:CPA2 family monovalent cation:H+ antiporter-2
MLHDAPLITTIAAGLGVAWALGLLSNRLGLSPIVGYLLAGVVIGPHTPGFVGDAALAPQLAEIGVVLLMFGVGLHFHLADLLAVRGVAIPGALLQSASATVVAALIARAFGWPLMAGVVFGLALAVASTVVLMRVLEDRQLLDTVHGHVAVGWLIVEDILTVLVLVTLPALAVAGGAAVETGSLLRSIGAAMVKLAALAALVLLAGSRVVPRLLELAARQRSRELFTLTVLALAMAIATGSAYVFGASMALGAFLAGMVVGQSPLSQQAAADALPMRDAFAVLFFVSVGMMLDPRLLLTQPGLVLATLGVVLVVKPLAAIAVVAALGYSARTALTVALGLAQIGEFSFILADLATAHALLPPEARGILVAVAIVSITINPMLIRQLDAMESGLRRRPALWRLLNARAERHRDAINATVAADVAGLRSLAVVVGFGPVGQAVDRLLRDAGLETVVIDLNVDVVQQVTGAGRRAVYGDATNAAVLTAAGVARASHLLITLPHSVNRRPLIAAAREANPGLRILVRARYLREREDLEQAGATAAVFEEAEAAIALGRRVLEDIGAEEATIDREAARIRRELSPGAPNLG